MTVTEHERRRFAPKKRRDSILAAAVRVAMRPQGWLTITRGDIALEAGCSDGLVSQYFGSMKSLKGLIMVTAIKREYVEIVAQGFASGHVGQETLTAALKDKIVKYLLHGA